jgi:hypothetical protein
MSLSLVRFRLFEMPCCGQALCWVNPRLPNYCPECGTNVFIKVKSGEFTCVDSEGELRVKDPVTN